MRQIGHVRGIQRYPIKSMAGIPVESAFLGWHGLAGDRRFAFRRVGDDNGFPWLSASRLPEMLLYRPLGLDERTGEPLPTHVRLPGGVELEIGSAELDAYLSERCGAAVELMRLKHGIFDEAPVSVISLATIAGVGRATGLDLDPRRFRANLLVETESAEPFLEDGWVGATLVFGGDDASPAVRVTLRDLRCVMINFDPDTGEANSGVMKAAVGLNGNNAGVYATVVRTGTIRLGDRVRLALGGP